MTSNFDQNPEPVAADAARWRFCIGLGVAALAFGALALTTGGEWRHALETAPNGKLTTLRYMHWGLWWASAVNALLCAGLALVSWRWGVGGYRAPRDRRLPRILRKEWLWLVLILAVAGGLRWARLDLSLYNDEAHTFRRYVAGHMLEVDKLEPRWLQVKWTDTFFLNKVGNNSELFSVLSRLCYDGWRSLTHAAPGELSEMALRFPSWVAGMGSLVVLWLLLRRSGSRHACWWGLALAALHPWHVRYSSEARGYGLLLLAVTLCFYFVVRALQDRRWRWWLALSGAQFLAAWSFPGAVYFLLTFNGLLLAGLGWKTWRGESHWSEICRLLISALIGGILTLEMELPTLPQLVAAINSIPSLKGEMGWDWWKDVVAGVLFGVRWTDHDPSNPFNLALARLLTQHPMTALAILPPIGIWLWTIIMGVRRNFIAAVIVAAGPLAMALSWAAMALQHKWLHHWYVIYAVPGMLAGFAVAFADGARRLRPPLRFIAALPLLPMVGLWLWADVGYLHTSKENMSTIVPLTRGARYPDYLKNPQHPQLVALFSDVDVYDPLVPVFYTIAELDAWIAKATQSGQQLYVTYSRADLIRGSAPDLLKRLNDRGEFTLVATYPGLEEPQFTHFVLLRR